MPKNLSTDQLEQLASLEANIASATGQKIIELQPKLHNLLREWTKSGYEIPTRLRHLDHDLEDEAAEALFDNMPL